MLAKYMPVPHDWGLRMVRLLVLITQLLLHKFFFLTSGVMRDNTQVISRRDFVKKSTS